jgi:DNA-binding transcriptional regulator YdaS (Cro superfamily)
MEKLRAYLNALPVEEQRAFAILCGTTIGYLRKAISQSEVISPITCVQIELHSDCNVTRKDLRTDWHLIWPELVQVA